MFGKEFIIGKIFGIKIAIDYSWFWIFLLITWSFAMVILPSINSTRNIWGYIFLGLLGSSLFFLSVIIHELSHTLIARKKGMEVNKITLFLFGGISNLEDELPDPKTEIRMAIAGPIASIIVGSLLVLITYFLFKFYPESLTLATIQIVGFVNIFLAVFNMIPGFPLDGGRVFRGIIWLKSKDLLRSTYVAGILGQVIAGFIIAFGIIQIFVSGFFSGTWLVLVGVFLFINAKSSFQQTLIITLLKKYRIKDILIQNEIYFYQNNTVQLAYEAVLSHPKNAYIVKNRKEEILGYILVDDIAKVPTDKRNITMLSELIINCNTTGSIDVNATGFEILKKLNQNYKVICVIDRDSVIGVLCESDIINFIKFKLKEFVADY